MAPKALVVDDEKIIRDIFVHILSNQNYKVVAVENGYEAIKKVKEDSFDIIFLDIRMPGIDGMETLKEIRKINKDVSVNIVSGFIDEEIIEKGKKESVDHFIEKPFKVEQIIKIIKSINKV